MERRLPVIVEGLIITAFIFAVTFAYRMVNSLVMPMLLNSGIISASVYSVLITILNGFVWMIVPVLATLICVKAIENRHISMVKVILIPLGVGFVINLLASVTSLVASLMGAIKIITMISTVNAIFLPILAGALITLLLNLFSGARR